MSVSVSVSPEKVCPQFLRFTRPRGASEARDMLCSSRAEGLCIYISSNLFGSVYSPPSIMFHSNRTAQAYDSLARSLGHYLARLPDAIVVVTCPSLSSLSCLQFGGEMVEVLSVHVGPATGRDQR